ncbi:MAG: hypothetical protein P4L99_21855 [Chthoniobacter sp.]|nr:hypothetical protein [Chthoniobacter sp.]
MKVEIEWHNAEETKPDMDTTVLVGFEEGDCEIGYFDSESDAWRSAGDAMRFNQPVVAWADLPPVPNIHQL